MMKHSLFAAMAFTLMVTAACAVATPTPTSTPTPTPTPIPRVAETHSHGQEEQAIKLEVLMGEFYFQVEGQEKNAPIVLEAGTKYEIEFKNVGAMLHEVMIGKDVKMEEGKPHGYHEYLLEEVEVEIKGKMLIEGEEREFEIEAEGLEELELDPGVEMEVEFTLPGDRVGDWEIGCFVPGHYEAGMYAPVQVR